MSCPIQVTYSTAENFIQPTTVWNDETKLYDLVENYVFEWGSSFNRKRLTRVVPYAYDKASVPRLLQGLARSDGPWDGPSLLHDNLYGCEGIFTDEFYYEEQINGVWVKVKTPWKRPLMDWLLAYAGECAGVPKWDAQLYRLSVRLYPVNWFKPFN